ncbi:hypothetical protein ZWY2020_034651 [Hordeum vulgare]|nr:hypothetical protein ZWY2020_034651 [Hordeum vulgare]
MAYVPGAAGQRPANSSCTVESMSAMEEEAFRLRSTTLILTAVGNCSGISADMVANEVDRKFRLLSRDVVVAPFFPDDFLLTLYKPFQRDLVLESRSIEVAGVRFKFRSWLPPHSGGGVRFSPSCHRRLALIGARQVSKRSLKGLVARPHRRRSTTKTNVKALFAGLGHRIERRSACIGLQCPQSPRRRLPKGIQTRRYANGGRQGRTSLPCSTAP